MKHEHKKQAWTVLYTRHDGTTGSVVCSLESGARRDADYYRQLGYTVRAVRTDYCEECNGEGVRSSKRNHYKKVTCPVCKGKEPAIETPTELEPVQ